MNRWVLQMLDDTQQRPWRMNRVVTPANAGALVTHDRVDQRFIQGGVHPAQRGGHGRPKRVEMAPALIDLCILAKLPERVREVLGCRARGTARDAVEHERCPGLSLVGDVLRESQLDEARMDGDATNAGLRLH